MGVTYHTSHKINASQSKKKKYSNLIPMGKNPTKHKKNKIISSMGISPMRYLMNETEEIVDREALLKEKRSMLVTNYQVLSNRQDDSAYNSETKLFERISTINSLISTMSDSISEWKKLNNEITDV